MNLSFPSSNHHTDKYKVLYNEANSIVKLSHQLYQHWLSIPRYKDIVILCIGTDRSTGDALGPLVGTKLMENKRRIHHVYGTLDEPVHAVNLEEKINLIQTMHNEPFIVAIDACLGQLDSIGQIQICEGPLKPGAGVKKTLPSVGNMHITGVVNVGGFMEYFVLQNTRLNLVMNMAKVISASISTAFRELGKSVASDPMN